MSAIQGTISVIGEHRCPFYKIGDQFKLSGHALSLPCEKPACMILLEDIRRILPRSTEVSPIHSFYCSGCGEGLIKLDYKRETEISDSEDNIPQIAGLLRQLSIFNTLKESHIKELVPFLKFKKFSAGDVVIRKHERSRNLFIIVSGTVAVVDDSEMVIAVLGKGEIVGEMSVLSGDPAIATVRAAEAGSFLMIDSNYFRQFLNRFPPLQIYMVRLLTKRLALLNVERVKDVSSAMTGKLSDIPPPELLQTLHVHQKTGILLLNLRKGEAKIYFKEGEVVGVEYHAKQDEEAFYEILKESEGRFSFIPRLPSEKLFMHAIGDMTKLLMVGWQKAQEASEP